MEIDPDGAVALVTLKLTINRRGDPVLTTLPVANLADPPAETTRVFPQIAIGGGFSTRLIFINTDTTQTVTGRLRFHRSDGTRLAVPIGTATGNVFDYQVRAGGGRLFLPGNTASPARLVVLDRATQLETTEVVLNQGNRLRPRVLVVDSAGTVRNDFRVTYSSIDEDIAAVDSTGAIEGKQAGFSTLTLSVSNIVAAVTVTVVEVESGVGGFVATGIVEDLGRNVYLASGSDHTIRRAEGLGTAAELYAGVRNRAGLKNTVRLQAEFNEPAFRAINQADGALFVSDAANHVIRRVAAGPEGRVETLAGTGVAGGLDGAALDAQFNNPQGVALDNRGFLWVADSANHVVRRINLATSEVETVAGRAGVAGSVDGTAAQARLNRPTGLALEVESAGEQLRRELAGERPPPVRMVVTRATGWSAG